jgi:hypothetical protein
LVCAHFRSQICIWCIQFCVFWYLCLLTKAFKTQDGALNGNKSIPWMWFALNFLVNIIFDWLLFFPEVWTVVIRHEYVLSCLSCIPTG